MQPHFPQRLRGGIRLLVFRLRNWSKAKFECPICGYRGPFKDINPPTGLRQHAECPNCSSVERHRLQFLVTQSVLEGMDTSQMRMLHFAPEAFFRDFFAQRFGKYETADLDMPDVTHNVDLCALPFADSSYDFVFASHVLEHIPDDKKAIREIRRILRPSGIAILPVPVVSESTIEYSEPNPHESDHVRAPGFDYFDRYAAHFSRVARFASDSFPDRYQLFVYEDRSRWPTAEFPLRTAMVGEKHIDIVPVCYA
jgi:SAM-dependent methyltransferase